jgi:hypothetical protein
VVEDLGNWSYNKLFLNKKKWDGSLKMRGANFNYVIFSLIISNFLFDFGGKRD